MAASLAGLSVGEGMGLGGYGCSGAWVEGGFLPSQEQEKEPPPRPAVGPCFRRGDESMNAATSHHGFPPAREWGRELGELAISGNEILHFAALRSE